MQIYDVLVLAEFRGGFPDVPLAEGVDYDSLIAGDTDPFFVTLPVAEVDAVSGNKRHYDGVFVQELASQVLNKRPLGNMGHLPDEQRSTAFPMPASHWVGVKLEGKTLWGKAYVPPGEVREFVRRMKATGSKIATSIYGTGEQVWNAERGAYSVKNFNLESIDFAPAERAGVGSLAAVPQVTKETKEPQQMGEQVVVDKLAVLKELTANDVQFLPDVVRGSIVASSAESKALAEMATMLGVESSKALETVRELVVYRQQMEAERVAGLVVAEVAKHVMPDAKQITEQVTATRTVVAELVKARKPQEADIAKVVAEITERSEVKAMIAAAVVAEMGPALGTQTKREVSGDGWKKLVNLPGK